MTFKSKYLNSKDFALLYRVTFAFKRLMLWYEVTSKRYGVSLLALCYSVTKWPEQEQDQEQEQEQIKDKTNF